MSKYNDASFIMPQAPYIKAGEIEVLKPVSGGNLTVDRNSKARIIDVNGDDVEVLEDVPCYDYRGDYEPPTDNSNYQGGTNISLDNPLYSVVTNPFGLIIKVETGSDITTEQVIYSNTLDSNNRLVVGVNFGLIIFTTYNGSFYNSTNYVIEQNTVYTFGFSKDETNGSKVFYLNGVSQSTTSINNLTTSSVLGNNVNSDSNDAFPFLGKTYTCEDYNYQPTGQEFEDRYNGLPIPDKYKGATDVDLVTNGDMEVALATVNGVSFSGNNISITQSSDFAKSGTKSLKALVNGINSNLRIIPNDITLLNKLIRVEFWIYVVGGISGEVKINVKIDDIIYNIDTITDRDSWVRVSYSVTSLNQATDRLVLINASTALNGDRYYIDDFKITCLGNTLNLSTGKTDSTWYDLDHDIQGTVNGANLNDSTDFGNNTYQIETCPVLLTQGQDITNRFQDSANPINQTINGLTAGVTYTLSCKGNGVVTVVESGGTGLGGTATEVYPLTITPQTTSVVLTLSAGHSLEYVNFTNTSYAVNHILTPNGGIATRLKDEITGGGDVNTFNSDELVIGVSMAALVNESGLERIIAISDNSSDNRMRLGYDTALNKLKFVLVNGGVTQYEYEVVVDDVTKFKVLKFKCKTNDFGVKIDGIELDTQNSGTMVSAGTFNTIELANGVGSFNLSARTKDIIVYKSIEQY